MASFQKDENPNPNPGMMPPLSVLTLQNPKDRTPQIGGFGRRFLFGRPSSDGMIGRTRRRYPMRILIALIALLTGLPATAQTAFATFEAASDPVLENPHDLVLGPDGRLYVSDLGNHRIAVLDPVSLAVVGEIGAGALSSPHDATFDEAGRLLVADTGNDSIAIFEDGKLTGRLSERIRRPEGVVALPGGRVVATGAGSGNAVLYVEGQVVAELSGMASPHDVELGPPGSLWLADTGHDRMIRVTEALEVLEILDAPEFRWNGPRYQDMDPAGNLIVADKYSHQIKRVSPIGRLSGLLGAEAGKGPGLFRTPEGVEIDSSTLYLSDSGNDRVVRYRMNGK